VRRTAVLYEPCPLSWRAILSTVFDGFLTPGTELGGTLLLRERKMGVNCLNIKCLGGRLQVLRSHWEFSVLALEAKTKQDQSQTRVTSSMSPLIHLVLLLCS
jgi:hypothetical protein